jgi:putative hydrolase of the HAD superfamily
MFTADVPLLLLDLDNTLIDRDGAFRVAVTGFLQDHELPAADTGWLMRLDASGYTPRAEVARAINRRYGPAVSQHAVSALLDRGGADHVVLGEAARHALHAAAAAGWIAVAVTNGTAAQQEAKLRISGLDRILRGWVISETAGHRKPDPAIFAAAAETAGRPLNGAWMIGDSPQADIGGASAAGISSVWLSAGRPWPALPYQPTHIAANITAAVDHILNTGPASFSSR